MTALRWNSVLGRLRSLAAPVDNAANPDAELLSRFVSRLDETAFAALLRRHGPMVLRVARRTVKNQADAEDVFQATFMLLARKAASIRKPASLASWLHGVAHRLALKTRSHEARRKAREEHVAKLRPAPSRADSAWRQCEGVLDEALAQLPDKYRTPLVCCYLEGRTQEEVAQLLGVPLGTVRSWLARGRDLLRRRLLRRGLSCSVAGLASTLVASAATAAHQAVAPALLVSTLQPALCLAGGQDIAGMLSPRTAALIQGETSALLLHKLKLGTICALLLLVVAGTAVAVQFAWVMLTSDGSPPSLTPSAQAGPGRNQPKEHVDLQGDPLPADAVGRLGTVRFRHENLVDDFALSADGRRIAAVAGHGLIVWDAASGRPLLRQAAEADRACVAFAPDGETVLLGGTDGVMHLLDAATGKVLRSFAGHKATGERFERGIWGLGFGPGGRTLVSWGSDKTVRVWEVSPGKQLRQFGKEDWTVHGLSPDGSLLTATRKDAPQTVLLIDVATGNEIRQLPLPGELTRLAFSADGKLLAAGWGELEKPCSIGIWELESGKQRGMLVGHKASVFALAFSPDGKQLASGGYDHTLRLWDLGTYKESQPPHTLRTPVYQVAFTKDGKTLVLRAFEHQVRLWDVATWKERVTDGPAWGLGTFAYSPDGKLLAAPSFNRIWIWEAATGKLLRTLEAAQWAVHGVAWTPDGKVLVSGSSDGVVQIWNVQTGKAERSWKAGAGKSIDKLALAADGVTLALWGNDNPRNLELWHLITGKKLHTLEVTSSQPQARPTLHALCFAPDGKTVYVGSGTHLVVLRWDVATGKALPSLGPLDGGVNDVAVAPDGRSVAAVSMDDSLFVWETVTGQARLVVKGSARAGSVAISPDGRWLALANRTSYLLTGDKEVLQGFTTREEVRLVDAADGKEVHRFRGHAGPVGRLAFAPDGRTLASASDDTTILLWDLTTRHPAAPPAPAKLSHAQLATLWTDLRGDAKTAYTAMLRFMVAPAAAASFLAEQVQPVAEADKEQMATLLARLAGNKFADREEATRQLKQLGNAAEPALRQALRDNPPLEIQRRLELLLDGLQAERPRLTRALEILERLGDMEARGLLQRLARGAAGSWLTDDARGSLQRLERRDKQEP
jgi:RNA polymerase sigma factor (sigma-70 family)